MQVRVRLATDSRTPYALLQADLAAEAQLTVPGPEAHEWQDADYMYQKHIFSVSDPGTDCWIAEARPASSSDVCGMVQHMHGDTHQKRSTYGVLNCAQKCAALSSLTVTV